MKCPGATRRLVSALTVLALAATALADGLRNVDVGDEVPAFDVATSDGARISREDVKGKVLVLVFVAAEQRSSEKATIGAHQVTTDLHRDDLVLVFATADTARAAYFRDLRDRTGVHVPLAFDFDRSLYGDLGLIVLPTTIVVDREGRLAHVISSYKSDYEHVLKSYVMHALDLIDDEDLEKRLTNKTFHRDRPSDRIARHRAAARLLRETGLPRDAENELRAALAIDARHAETMLDLAALCVSEGRVAEAETMVEQVLEEEPYHRRGRLLRGITLYHAGRLDEAETVLRKALVLNPDPVHTRYYLGLILEKQGRKDEALEQFREALARLLVDRPL